MVRWVRANQALFRGNPAVLARTGIYFSNLTFVMNDYFPLGWSHGTGPFGQYFTVLNTYYMATANQVPLRVLTTPLGHEDRLGEMLQGLDRLIIADAIVMTDAEVEAVLSWVEQGGVLINIGASGILDEYRRERPGGLAGRAGIAMTEARPREVMVFTEAWPADGDVKSIPLDGSNESLFIERYQSNRIYALGSPNKRAHYYPERWPLHLRDKDNLLEETRRLQDPRIEDWPPLGAPGLKGREDAEILARFGDGEAAVISQPFGRGYIIQIAPTDWLTRYRNSQARESAHVLFHDVTQTEVCLTGAGNDDLASVELVVTGRESRGNRALVVHLIRHVHDDQAIPPAGEPLQGITVDIQLPTEEAVTFVRGFSPDSDSVDLDHTRDGDVLRVKLQALDVYTAIMIGLKK